MADEAPPKEAPEETPPQTRMVDEAVKAAERLEAANIKMEENLARQEALFAKQRLGGETHAGTAEPKKPEPPSPADYAKEVKAGRANPLRADGFI